MQNQTPESETRLTRAQLDRLQLEGLENAAWFEMLQNKADSVINLIDVRLLTSERVPAAVYY